MFYSQFILAKKGPLGTIWIAAHLERKLRKNQVAETDIGVTVDSILFPEVPIALRLSGHLLLGVVRIYSRQVNYLFNDCSETLLKIKQAFHSTAVDLPPEATTAPFHSITLPETFDFDELELLPDSESSFLGPNGKYVDHHVTTREQITLQDRIENNPYLGSSQFGPDERFGDGNCSPMGLDFDEEFLAEKPHSSAASTSTPLLKEDILPSPSGCGGDEGIRMDIDDHYESSEPIFGLHKADSNEQRTTVVFRSDEIEADGQQNTFSLTPLVDPLNEPAAMEAVSSKVSDSVLFKNDIPSFHAYTPHIFDARTPDLNQEFCPPDEPSTPALPDETSLPMYKESNIESSRSPPVMLGHFERNTSTELHPGSLPPKQVSVLASLEQPKQELPSAQYFLPSIRQASAPSSGPAQANTAVFLQQMQSHLQTSFVDSMQHSIPPFPTQSLGQGVSSITNDSSSTHFQGFPLHQASSVGVTRDAFLVSSLTQRDEKSLLQPVSSLEETRDSVSAPFQIFPQPAFLQQSRAAASDEAVFLSAGTSNPLLPSLVTSMASLHQPTGSSSAALSHQCPLSMSNQEVSSLFQQHRTTASSDYAQASYRGTGEVSSVLQPHSMANRISTSPFVPKASLLPSFSASSGSILPLAKDSSLFGHTETMDLDTQAMHKTQDLASSKGLFWHPAAQQLSSSSTAPMPSILPSVHVKDIPQFETLRSAADSQRKESDFLFLQKDMLDERIPALEVDRVKAHIMSFDRVSKGAIQPEFDKTPTFREETPLTAAKPSRLSTCSLDSLPGDDDVLASILGRRTNPFKVISTPKENLVVKRPKVALRSVLKKRKNDFDTLAVLHGDVIRQQLAYTEDIRRERRKVPCTRREVWHLNQETQCQQNFDEPSLLGLSIDLHDLYHDILGVNESRFSSSDLIGATTATPVFEPERSRWDTKSMSELPSELVNKGSSKHDCHVCPNEVLSTPENALLEGSMEQVKGDIKTAPEILIGSSIRMASMKDLSPQAQVDDGTSSQNGSVTEELVFPMVDTEPVAGEVWNKMVSAELRASEDIDTNGIVSRKTEASEPAMEQNIVLDAAVESIGQVQVDTFICNSTDMENGGGIVSATVGKDSGAIALQGDTGTVVEDRQHGLGLHEQDAHQEIAIPNKDADLGSLEVLPDAENVTERPLVKFTDRDEGNAESGEKQSTLNVSEEMVDFCGDDEPFGFMANERDTDFLAADDDMAYAEVDGYSSDEHDALIQDNGGWSARSRNVGRYLKTVFEGMDGSSRRSKDQGHAVLGLERLLAQKTKKEAARMFFETLVLKTRDYIQVEQNTAYEDIHLYPRTKLMKTNF